MTHARTYAHRARRLRTVPPKAGGRSFLEALNQTELDALRARGAIVACPRRGVLFRERELADSVFLLLEGRVKLVADADRRPILVTVCGRGDLVGELAAVGAPVHTATALAVEPVSALRVPTLQFRRLALESPRLALLLLTIVGRRAADCERRRVELAALDTAGRVASSLIDLAERFGERAGNEVEIDLGLSQQELAGWAGASLKAATTALQRLRDSGCIETGRASITVRDMAALRAWAA